MWRKKKKRSRFLSRNFAYMQSALRRPLLTAVHHRSLWTKATASGRDIKECIATVCEPWKDKRANACIALVSKSFSDYGNVVHELNERLQPSTLVGAVVDRVAGLQHGITLYVGDEDEKVVGFHTADTRERHKVRSISVGRWGRIEDFDRLRFQGNKLNEYGWDAFGTISRPAQQYALPPPLAGCTDTPSFIFMASDNEPDQLLQALDHHYPNATKVGTWRVKDRVTYRLKKIVFESLASLVHLRHSSQASHICSLTRSMLKWELVSWAWPPSVNQERMRMSL